MESSDILAIVKPRLEIADTDSDAFLLQLIADVRREILNWRYRFTQTIPTSVPTEYESVWIEAVIVAYNMTGVENQTSHAENGVSRIYSSPDVVSYIHSNVVQMAGCIYDETTETEST